MPLLAMLQHKRPLFTGVVATTLPEIGRIQGNLDDAGIDCSVSFSGLMSKTVLCDSAVEKAVQQQ